MVALADIRHCMEGAVPSIIATCDLDGVPNLSYVSQVHYLDPLHVALTFQFFNKTHRNILDNPQATVYVTDPDTAAQYRLSLLFRHSETDGTLFSAIKAKLAGIAAHTGMTGVFQLKGLDVYRVLDIQCACAGNPALAPAKRPLLPALRELSQTLAGCEDLTCLFDSAVNGIGAGLAMDHVSLLMADESGDLLYTVASAGFPVSGIGAEVPVGYGLIGVCAREKTPIRLAFGASEYSYHNAIVHYSQSAASPEWLETAIPFPELAEPASQLAVPLLLGERLLGVIYVESEQQRRFTYEDEDALCVLAPLIAARYLLITATEENGEPEVPVPARPPDGPLLCVQYYPANHTVFIDHDYLIKGVAGAILWRILQHYQQEGRQEFSNRELRLDPALGLPEIGDNLESRLVLLQKRLAERSVDLGIEKCGRGRFRLCLRRPLSLRLEAEPG